MQELSQNMEKLMQQFQELAEIVKARVQEAPTGVMAGRTDPAVRDQAEEPRPRSAGRGGTSVPVEVGPSMDQPGDRGQDRGSGLDGESADSAHSYDRRSLELGEGMRSRNVPGMPKLKIPRLHGEKGWPKFNKSFESFALMHEFSDVLESALEVNVGRSGVRRHEEMGRLGITAETFNLHLKAWMILNEAFPNVVDQGRLTSIHHPVRFGEKPKSTILLRLLDSRMP